MFIGLVRNFVRTPYYSSCESKVMSKFCYFLLLINILSSPLLYAIPQTNRDNQKQLHDLRSRIDALQKDLADKESSKTKAAEALRDSERSINDLYGKISQLASQQKNVQDKLTRLQKKSAQLQDKASIRQAQLGKLIYYQHLTKHQEYLQLLFRQQNPDSATRNFYYYKYIVQARSKNIDDLRNQLADLDTLTRASYIQNQSLEQIRSKQAYQKQQLELEKKRRSEILASLSEEVSHQRKKINTLKQDELRLSRLIEKLNKQLAHKKSTSIKQSDKDHKSILRNNKLPGAIEQKGSFAALKGKLRLPVQGELINRFGSARENSSIKWKGLFIRSPKGNEVKAIANGEVIFSDWLRGFGNLMILDHGGHYMSLYGNNEAIYKRTGNKVKSGDTIAIVGNSGENAESGLYFELRYQGKPFDPLSWVKIE